MGAGPMDAEDRVHVHTVEYYSVLVECRGRICQQKARVFGGSLSITFDASSFCPSQGVPKTEC